MKILIVGANGFIGSHITAKLLLNNYEIIAAVKDIELTKLKFPSIKVVKCNLNSNVNIESWIDRLKEIDIVINAAGLLTSSTNNKIENVQ